MVRVSVQPNRMRVGPGIGGCSHAAKLSASERILDEGRQCPVLGCNVEMYILWIERDHVRAATDLVRRSDVHVVHVDHGKPGVALAGDEHQSVLGVDCQPVRRATTGCVEASANGICGWIDRDNLVASLY